MTVNRDIVGQGWRFPPGIDRQGGGVAIVSGDSEINQSIEIILRTIPGQRVMRPTFGSQLHELVFAPNNTETAALAQRYVTEALGMWEPRISVLAVEAYPNPHERQQMLIDISYEIKASYDRRSLVFPFYLIPEE